MRPVRVLLIEDHPDTAMLVQDALEMSDHGFDVNWVATGAEAICMDLEEYDVVVLDHILPDALGLDLIPELLQKRQLPILLFTGDNELHLGIQAIKRGAMAYLVKRGDYLHKMPREILRTIERFQTLKALQGVTASLTKLSDPPGLK